MENYKVNTREIVMSIGIITLFIGFFAFNYAATLQYAFGNSTRLAWQPPFVPYAEYFISVVVMGIGLCIMLKGRSMGKI